MEQLETGLGECIHFNERRDFVKLTLYLLSLLALSNKVLVTSHGQIMMEEQLEKIPGKYIHLNENNIPLQVRLCKVNIVFVLACSLKQVLVNSWRQFLVSTFISMSMNIAFHCK